MAIFNVNQNRQFYVINEIVADTVNTEGKVTKVNNPTKAGQVKLCKTKDGQIFFKHFGMGGLTRTDLIDVDKSCYAKLTTKADMQRNPKKAIVTLSDTGNNKEVSTTVSSDTDELTYLGNETVTVYIDNPKIFNAGDVVELPDSLTSAKKAVLLFIKEVTDRAIKVLPLNGVATSTGELSIGALNKGAKVVLKGNQPIVGQDYVMRVQINNYLAPGDACVLIKSAAVRATTGMTAGQFYNAMKESLERAFGREASVLLKFDVTEAGLVITGADEEQPWRLGVLSKEPVNFEVIPTTVIVDGEEVIWGTVEYGTDTTVTINNGTKVADLEYFCMAERGDVFRNMGWPNNIDVKYMVDPSKGYDMLDLHYYYSGNGVQVHKSEKDITFVSATDSIISNLKTALTGAGITVTE